MSEIRTCRRRNSDDETGRLRSRWTLRSCNTAFSVRSAALYIGLRLEFLRQCCHLSNILSTTHEALPCVAAFPGWGEEVTVKCGRSDAFNAYRRLDATDIELLRGGCHIPHHDDAADEAHVGQPRAVPCRFITAVIFSTVSWSKQEVSGSTAHDLQVPE